MRGRTDLAIERFENITAKSATSETEGISKNEYEKFGCKCTDIEVESDSASEVLGKEKGRYITVSIPDLTVSPEDEEAAENALSDIFRSLIPPYGTVLIAGLGNAEITPDSLGPIVAGRIFTTRHIPEEVAKETGLSGLRTVCALPIGVLGQTGIESEETVRVVAESVDAAAVIVIDALAAGSITRLFNTVQITDTGISPGSGVQNKRKKISKESLGGIPVIAVGVPTVTDADSIITESGGEALAENMVVTPKDIDRLIRKTSKVLSKALNRALFPNISPADLDYLVL